jgi:drug/metabolite transporter (DMT)-like permease
MSLPVFLVVLGAAALHATWNAIVKGAADTLLTTLLIATTAAAVALCTLPFLPAVAPASWIYLGFSSVLEIIYYGLVAAAYRHTEMSSAYPLMRGAPPLLVLLASTLLLGVTVPLAAWIGVILISTGLLSLLLRRSGADPRGFRFALANAFVIAGYTLIDGYGVRASGAPATYVMWLYVLAGVPIGLWALVRRRDFVGYAARNWHLGLIGGCGALASYGLVLWAMTQSPIPVVAALRETSILFGTAIAAFVLGEKVPAIRITAVIIIAIGAAVLRLA